MAPSSALRRTAPLVAMLLIAGLVAPVGWAESNQLFDPERLKVGVGDRLIDWNGSRPRRTFDEAQRHGLRLDLLQLWLPRGWQDDWIPKSELARLAQHGVVPVVVHYYFGDAISKERVEAQREGWYASLRRMAQRVRMDTPVLVVLEPEFNIAPPDGETAILDWPGFARDLSAAAELIRKEAPNALVGTCPGDFPGPPRLEAVLGPVASQLDFLAFQEMRASTDPEVSRAGYLQVGKSAVDYAGYLQRAFGRPLLLGYVALSSHGRGWTRGQAMALQDLVDQRDALRRSGVFGLIYFQLSDDPEHNGYFGPAERHFGLLTLDGRPKPALRVFRQLTR